MSIVSIRSRIGTEELSKAFSAKAIAIKRRRIAQGLAKLCRELANHAEKDDFHSYVFPLFDDIRISIDTLLTHERVEGNSCIILRYVRNTLLNRGHELYKQPTIRQIVVTQLEILGHGECITPEHVKAAYTAMYKAGLRPGAAVEMDSSEFDGWDEDGESNEVSD